MVFLMYGLHYTLQAPGGNLAVFESAEEEAFVNRAAVKLDFGYFWIGCK